MGRRAGVFYRSCPYRICGGTGGQQAPRQGPARSSGTLTFSVRRCDNYSGWRGHRAGGCTSGPPRRIGGDTARSPPDVLFALPGAHRNEGWSAASPCLLPWQRLVGGISSLCISGNFLEWIPPGSFPRAGGTIWISGFVCCPLPDGHAQPPLHI